MDSNPKTFGGLVHWAGIGVGAAILALVIGAFFPSIVPARATQVRL